MESIGWTGLGKIMSYHIIVAQCGGKSGWCKHIKSFIVVVVIMCSECVCVCVFYVKFVALSCCTFVASASVNTSNPHWLLFLY